MLTVATVSAQSGTISAPTTPTPKEQAEAEKALPVATAVSQGAVSSVVTTAPEQAKQAEATKDTLNLPQNYRGIVRVEMSKRRSNYKMPWQSGNYGGGTGTAFMVGPGLFMTNAHVIADGETIYISKYGDSRKIPAKVKHAAHDADLALLEISEKDREFFRDIKELEFSDELPRLEDTVRAVGYPVGGSRLSITRGIVSRIDTRPYSHPRNSAHLCVQIDAAINPGNSGGPVFLGDKVVGVAFQGLLEANSTGYIIPAPVIKRFFKDIEDGNYDKYVDLGVDFFPLQNPAMRRHFGLKDDGKAVLVGQVIQGGTADQVLEAGDVLLSINGKEVDSSAMIELDGERVNLTEIAERSFKGDELRFSIIRNGEKMEKVAKLLPRPHKGMTGPTFGEYARYVTYGGLVFQPMDYDMVQEHRLGVGNITLQVNDFLLKSRENPKKDLVMLTQVLPDEANSRQTRFGTRLVNKVNGVEVLGLSHLYELLYPEGEQTKDGFTTIEFEGADIPIIFERKTIEDTNRRIWSTYAIDRPARLESTKN